MPNLLDVHDSKLSTLVKKYGRPVLLTEPDDITTHELMAIWNDVEHILKIDSLNGDPMGNRSSLYFARIDLQVEGGEIKPGPDWKATGSPNKYDPEKDYILRIPKNDNQLPGVLFFLEETLPDTQNYPAPGDLGS